MAKTTAENLEARFEAGENVLDYFDTSHGIRPGWERQKINVDTPRWMVQALDRIAGRQGISRQSLLKGWINERLKQETKAA